MTTAIRIRNFHICTYVRHHIICIIILWCFLSFFPIFAQNGAIKITGNVLDSNQEPLSGARISLADSEKTGTVSDANGHFILSLPALPSTLSIRYLGYKPAVIQATDSRHPLTVVMEENTDALNEVVIVGYGTQRRRELTGSIASLPAVLLKQPALSLDAILGGAISGVNVTQTSGQPGEGSSIRIRGSNSVHADNDPLYVIDGFIFFNDKQSGNVGLGGIESNINPLSAVNPADIESIEVLKDVSATAIYGSRGANGVIIVTTKKGTRGKESVHYQYRYGVQKLAKKVEIMNGEEWLNLRQAMSAAVRPVGEGSGYDWQKAVFQTGISQNHDLSFSGGDEKTKYLVSGNYTNQKGIIINTGFERFGGRVNLERSLSSRFTIGLSATASRALQQSLTTFGANDNFSKGNDSPYARGVANSLTYALYIPPTVPIYNIDGTYNTKNNPYEYGYLKLGDHWANPVADLNGSIGENMQTVVLGSFFARYELAKGLFAKINAGTNLSYITQHFFAPSISALGINLNGVGGVGKRNREVTLLEYTLDYSRLFGIHSLYLLGGYTAEKTSGNFIITSGYGFSDETEKMNNLAKADKMYLPVQPVIPPKSTLNSFLGRINYSLKDRYHLTATFRADRSSRFAAGHRWGYYPSAGLSWNVNEEPFFHAAAEKQSLSQLKLRLTAGTVGSQEIGDYEYATQYATRKYAETTTSPMVNRGNANLGWQSAAQYNAGVDAGWIDNRITLSADVYYKKTYDLLFEAPVSAIQGGGTQLENIGNVINKGIELSVDADILDGKDLTWNVAANIAANRNALSELGIHNNRLASRSQTGQGGVEILREGEALGTFYGLRFVGIVQENEDATKLPLTSLGVSQAGDLKFADANRDGKIDAGDRVVLGSIQPDFIYGFTSHLVYRRFDVFIAFQGSKGNKVYNHLRRFLEMPTDYNVAVELKDSWTPDRPSNRYPSLAADASRTRPYDLLDSRYIEDASFLRLKNITVGYAPALPRGGKAVTVRLFVSAQNLFTFTAYKGYDPEVASGADLGTYPAARNISFGINLDF
ncbi:MAG: TonB-dependent receptor [Dysgonamonadaceae bacterium]|nr:TonB-dependent receptor [Dysgonamonadaceae bacterium]